MRRQKNYLPTTSDTIEQEAKKYSKPYAFGLQSKHRERAQASQSMTMIKSLELPYSTSLPSAPPIPIFQPNTIWPTIAQKALQESFFCLCKKDNGDGICLKNICKCRKNKVSCNPRCHTENANKCQNNFYYN